MAEKSARRLMLERSLEADPTDPFLRYGLAMQCIREGDTEEGRDRLKALLADNPGDQEVAAYQQLGQSHMEDGEIEPAPAYLQAGIEKARAVGNQQAANEMAGFLAQLG